MSYYRSHIPDDRYHYKRPSDYEFLMTASLSLLIVLINIVHIIHGFKAYPKYRRYKEVCRTVKPRLRFTPDGRPIAVLIVPPIYVDADMERLSWDSLQQWEDVVEGG
ncbi:hypothetical protein F4680DRAFT_443264 [Xylaria scruposa]|nr:hypothetical protein F4680DRAFT_443264 [Xylaria scruposa]